MKFVFEKIDIKYWSLYLKKIDIKYWSLYMKKLILNIEVCIWHTWSSDSDVWHPERERSVPCHGLPRMGIQHINEI